MFLLAVCALFAKWIDLPALYIVWGRCLFATLALYIYCRYKRINLTISKTLAQRLVISGALLALHWWSFFQSIQLTSVAIGLLTFATFPLYVPLLNFVLYRTPIQPLLLLQGLLCLFGIYLVVAADNLTSTAWFGLLLGLFSAACFALLTVFNRHYVQQQNPVLISFYQQGSALLLLSPWLLLLQQSPSLNDWLLFIVLGVFFTAFTHSLIIYSLRFIPAFTVSLSFTLEPVYGIFAAYLLLGESVTVLTIVGALLIVSTCAWASVKSGQSSSD
ncbi:DMT family transporter [Thalassotalea sp. Y01]|uniref:DMT family transporter n=1 Tax=Thalassotalea sp. Y01 TaxID=2729613 RepID=UPI0032B71976